MNYRAIYDPEGVEKLNKNSVVYLTPREISALSFCATRFLRDPGSVNTEIIESAQAKLRKISDEFDEQHLIVEKEERDE